MSELRRQFHGVSRLNLLYTIVPHRWQEAGVKFVLNLLATSSYCYIQAPTGVGKTIFICLVGEALPIDGTRMIIVGASKVAKQHRDTLRDDLGFVPLSDDRDNTDFTSPNGNRWIVSTWQAAASKPDSFKRDDQPCAALFFDECHLGGSAAANKSYRKIESALVPIKRVQVSATTNVASETLLGKRKDHSYIYTMTEAYDDDLLNPVNMVVIETGTHVVIEQIEAAFGKTMEEIEDNLPELARKMQKKKVIIPRIVMNPETNEEIEATKSARMIIEHRHNAMIELYIQNYAGESAIFWSPNIEAADAAAEEFAKRSDIPCTSIHSKQPLRDMLIDQFEQGFIKVIFAVGMLQEGFNMPELWLAFDCRFHRQLNKNRIARMMQRIGRTTRKMAGKPVSLYYVAPDLTHYYTKTGIPQGPLLAAHVLAAANALDPKDSRSVVQLNEGEEITLKGGIETGDAITGEGASSTGPGSDRDIKALSVPVYAIRWVAGTKEGQTVSLAELFGDDIALAKVDWFRRAKAGENPPSPNSNEGRRLSDARRNDPDFLVQISDAGWAPRLHLGRSDIVAAKDDFLRRALAGEKRPLRMTQEGQRLYDLRRSDPDFDKQLSDAGWGINPRPHPSTEAAKVEWLRRAKSGEPPPSYRTNDGRWLQRVRSRDTEFDKRISTAGWLRQKKP